MQNNDIASVRKIAILTSGGDAPGMNAAIRAIVIAAQHYKMETIGFLAGFNGLIDDISTPLSTKDVANIIHKGGTILKSARCPAMKTSIGIKQAASTLLKHKIDALIVIGGDGSFTGGTVFNKEFGFPIIGIPGTIDNDIFGTSHTLGYDTALNTAVDAIDKIRDTASSHNRLFFVEVMGRDAGFIALNAGVGAGAEEILIPEEDLGLDRLLESLKKSRRSGKSSSIVVVAEGDKSGKNVYELAQYVEDNMPEYEVRVSVLGHMQRGGSPTCFDRVLASRLGVKAVELMLDGTTNVMVGLKDNKVMATNLEKAIKGQHSINSELLRVSDIMTT